MQHLDQTQNVSITLRWRNEPARRYTAPTNSEALSLRWSYVVWKRRRWRDDENLLSGLAQRAVKDLGEFGIRAGDLDNIAESHIVEVGVSRGSRHLWYMPWESLLATATTTRRAGENLMVIRQLLEPAIIVPLKDETRSTSSASPLLFVQSMPGRLRRPYTSDTEYRLVRRALHLHGDHLIDTPTLEKIETEVARAQPRILHLSGVDSREGSIDLGIKDTAGWGDPGFYLQASAKESVSNAEPNALPQNPAGTISTLRSSH
jgi:hypothetical protein